MESVCDEIATMKVTGLIGIPSNMTKRLFSSFKKESLDPARSRFITFELDLSGETKQILDINWLNVRYPAFLKLLGVRTISVFDELKDAMFSKDL